MEANCGYCGVPAKLKCAGCQQVYYCNPDHQKKHWKAKHKHECVKPYEVIYILRLLSISEQQYFLISR